MFDTVSVAPDRANQFRTIILRKRQNCRANRVEQPAGQPSTRLRNDEFYAVAGRKLRSNARRSTQLAIFGNFRH